jgi:Mg2+ and Co2+ transporter CorA
MDLLSFEQKSDKVIYETCLDNIDYLHNVIRSTEDRLHILKSDLKKQEEIKQWMSKKMKK